MGRAGPRAMQPEEQNLTKARQQIPELNVQLHLHVQPLTIEIAWQNQGMLSEELPGSPRPRLAPVWPVSSFCFEPRRKT